MTTCECCAKLEQRIMALERFSNQITPTMDARQVILLWLQTHVAVSAASLACEVGEFGPTYGAIRHRLHSMCKEGILIRVRLGSYRRLM